MGLAVGGTGDGDRSASGHGRRSLRRKDSAGRSRSHGRDLLKAAGDAVIVTNSTPLRRAASNTGAEADLFANTEGASDRDAGKKAPTRPGPYLSEWA